MPQIDYQCSENDTPERRSCGYQSEGHELTRSGVHEDRHRYGGTNTQPGLDGQHTIGESERTIAQHDGKRIPKTRDNSL